MTVVTVFLSILNQMEFHLVENRIMEWNMIVVTVFLSILNQMEFHMVQKIESKTVNTIISPST